MYQIYNSTDIGGRVKSLGRKNNSFAKLTLFALQFLSSCSQIRFGYVMTSLFLSNNPSKVYLKIALKHQQIS